MLNLIHHVAIIVSDYEKSRKFYVEQLELPIIRENYRKESLLFRFVSMFMGLTNYKKS